MNPRRETKLIGNNGDRERGTQKKKSQKVGEFWRGKGGGEAEQSSASCDRNKQGIEHMRVDGRSQLPHTTYGRRRWMGRTASDERSIF